LYEYSVFVFVLVFAAIFSPLKEKIHTFGEQHAEQGMKVMMSGLVDLKTIVKKLNKLNKPASHPASSPLRASRPHKAAGLPALFNFFTMVTRSTKPDTVTFPCSASMLLWYTL
jgi:hypothetical protein